MHARHPVYAPRHINRQPYFFLLPRQSFSSGSMACSEQKSLDYLLINSKNFSTFSRFFCSLAMHVSMSKAVIDRSDDLLCSILDTGPVMRKMFCRKIIVKINLKSCIFTSSPSIGKCSCVGILALICQCFQRKDNAIKALKHI